MKYEEKTIMKNKLFDKTVSVVIAAAMACMLLIGCAGKSEAPAADASQTESNDTEASSDTAKQDENVADTSSDETASENASEVPGAPYFSKGVYANYSEELDDPEKTYFYIFSEDSCGYTADGANGGIGVPFDVAQSDGKVTFTFGGSDEAEDAFVITAVDADGKIHGYYEDTPERPLVFELLADVDAASFSAENYVNGPGNSVYHDSNGWSVRYDAERFEITPKGPEVFIVYTGESAGTNMITVTYTADNKAEAAIKELGDSWGDGTSYSQGPFPGAEYTTGYWAVLPPAEDGSGMYMTAIGRDYMDGALIFELTGHNGEDEEMNMAVSDQMAGIIDSLKWDVYDYETVLGYLSDGSWYAYADMDELKDALLVTSSEMVYDNGDGTMAASEATVFGYDKNGMIVQYGYVAGGGTATPLACKDNVLYYGGRDYMNKAHIDEGASEMVIDEGEYFDEYEDAVVVEFRQPEK